MRKLFSSLLAIVLTLCAFTDTFAQVNNKIYYTSTDGEIVTPYSTTSSDFGASIISNTYEDGQGCITFDGAVTRIGSLAFRDCSSLTSIEIPNSVTSIGYNAFYGCSGLTSIEIPSSVTSFGSYPFQSCSSLASIVVDPNNNIYDSRDNCNAIIETATNTLILGCSNTAIPNSVTSIRDYAFYGSGLTSIVIPSSVKSFSSYAFIRCSSLASIAVDPNNNIYDSRDYCNAIIETATNTLILGCSTSSIPNGVTSIGKTAFQYCPGLTSIVIPSSVTSIRDYAFDGCSGLTSIEIPNSVKSIGSSVFGGCSSLASIEIPSSVTSIGSSTFYGCSGLTSIVIPSSVTSIGSGAFSGCSSLTSIVIPNGVKSIVSTVFRGCSSLASIVIPNSVTSIGYYAFEGCSSLASIEIPNSVTSINSSAFRGCSSLTSIVVDPNNSIYDSRDNCNAIIETATNTLILGCSNTAIPNSVTSIGDYAFYGSGLTSIVIPNSVTSIGYDAFYGCSGLTSIEIPNSVTSIGEAAFYGCTSLPIYSNGRYAGTYLVEVIDKTVNDFTFKEGVRFIGSNAFTDCSNLASIEIPNSVTGIGAFAFWRCSGLTSIEIPNSVTEVGHDAFYSCEKLESVVISNNIKKLSPGMFGNCISLKSVVIPEGVEGCGELNPGIFGNCTSLTSIDISSSAVENLYMIFRDIDDFTNLKTIIIRQTTPPSITSYNNVQAISSPNIYVPASSVELYQATAPWNQWGQILPIVESVELADGEVYSGIQRNVDEFTYTRTFDNTAWQSMYVPFSIPVSVLDEKGLEVAEIYNVHQYDRDDDGIYEETNIDFLKMKSGATQANYPYMVRAKETGDVTFEFSSIEIAGAESVSIDCSTVKQLFTFTGTYDGISGSVMYNNNYYGMNGNGGLQRAASSSVSLKPQRWYLAITNRDGSPVDYYAPNVRITVDGIEEGFETSIEGITLPETEAVYTLSGQIVNGEALAPGIYVKGGKKIIVK